MVRSQVSFIDILYIGLCLLSLAACGGGGGLVPIVTPEHDAYAVSPSSGLASGPASGESFNWVIYIPFVDGVEAPIEPQAGHPFDITLRISADFRPATLMGLDGKEFTVSYSSGAIGNDYNPGSALLWSDSHVRVGTDENISLPSVIRNPYGEGQPASGFVYHFDGLPAGTWYVHYLTATDKGHGGIGWFYKQTWYKDNGALPGDPVEWLSQYVVKKELVITVLPAEGGAIGG